MLFFLNLNFLKIQLFFWILPFVIWQKGCSVYNVDRIDRDNRKRPS